MRSVLLACAVAMGLLAGCSDDTVAKPDISKIPDRGAVREAGAREGGAKEAGAKEAGATEAGAKEAGIKEAGPKG